MTGQTLLHYRILDKLGEGGMGVVYKARDTHLDRFAAIKVLPPETVGNDERKRRFIQEAKAASALNHPNIIAVYDINSDGGVDFIAMEFVSGKTLDRLIRRGGGLRLNETLKYAVQIADGLAKAHSAGIVHRDLKPGNIMVSGDGHVKLLDFGLAKLIPALPEPDDSTRTLGPQTEEGTIVGTVSYMSPEQAMGKTVDPRSDIFSFGAVLYEMVTGRRAFHGDSRANTLSAILRDNPKPAGEIAAGTPRDLEKIIARCLRKDAERRFQHMADVKVALQELKEESDSGQLGVGIAAVPARRHLPLVWMAASVVAVALGIAAWLLPKGGEPAMNAIPLSSYPGSEAYPSFSPDGNQVAFSWNGEKQDNYDIYVKLIDNPSALQLTTNPADDLNPVWSPDGRSIAFLRRASPGTAEVVLVPAIGGPERVVAKTAVPIGGSLMWDQSFLAWTPDGKWLAFADRAIPGSPVGLFLLSIDTGERHQMTNPPKSAIDISPAFAPDGRRMAFSRGSSPLTGDIYLLDLMEGFRPKGEPVRLAGGASPTWAADGKDLLYVARTSTTYHFTGGPTNYLWRIAASGGQPSRLPVGGEGASFPTVSGGTHRLACTVRRWDTNLYRVPLSGPGKSAGPAVQFVSSSRAEWGPQYSPDGRKIAFESGRSGASGIWIADADGSNAVAVVLPTDGSHSGTPRWSPDSQQIAFDWTKDGQREIYLISASGGGRPERLTNNPTSDIIPSFSRDGRWLYFGSNRSGRAEIWKLALGASGNQPVKVTNNGGQTAFESADGQWLIYNKRDAGSGLWRMPVGGGPETEIAPSVEWRAFAVMPQGVYFIGAKGDAHENPILFLDFATGATTQVALTSAPSFVGLAVSPDGRYLVYSQVDVSGSDLLLIENFR